MRNHKEARRNIILIVRKREGREGKEKTGKDGGGELMPATSN